MERIQIVYGFDKNYIDYFNMSVKTVLKNNKNCQITVLSTQPLNINYNNIVINNIQKYQFKTLKNRYSNATYLRLFIPEYINKEKVIYLDADTICKGPLNELYNLNIPYLGLVGTKDHWRAKTWDHDLYYNDGVMLMNIPGLKSINFQQICLRNKYYLSDNDKLFVFGETLVNCYFYDAITPIDRKYNNMVIKGKNPDKNAIIIHCLKKDKTDLKKYYLDEMNRK